MARRYNEQGTHPRSQGAVQAGWSTNELATPASAVSTSSSHSGGYSPSHFSLYEPEGAPGHMSWKSHAQAMWDEQLGMITPVYNQITGLVNSMSAWARADRKRWATQFKPLEDALIDDAKTYGTQAMRELQAGRAASEVTKQFQAQRQNAQHKLESYGIDPSQTRAQALDSTFRASQAAATAAEANNARRHVDDQKRQLRADAVNLGIDTKNRAASQAAAAGSLGVNAGNMLTNAYGTGAQYIQRGGALDLSEEQEAFKQWLGSEELEMHAANQNFTHGLAADQFALDQEKWDFYKSNYDDNNDSTGAYIAAGVQAAPVAYDIYQDWKRNQQGGTTNSAESGSGVVQANATGGPIMPRAALPVYDQNGSVEGAGGPKDDLVPARLSPGEYVMDEKTVRWMGEKHFRKMQEKAKEEMAEAMAKNPPKVVAALPVRGQ